MKSLERILKRIEGRVPPKKFRVYDIDVPWDGPMTQEQKDQLIDGLTYGRVVSYKLTINVGAKWQTYLTYNKLLRMNSDSVYPRSNKTLFEIH